MNPETDSEIKQAIIWDRPGLAAGAEPESGAKRFIDAMDLFRPDPEVEGEDPLTKASRGIALEVHGSSEDALREYRELASSEDPEVSLFGLCLLVWTDIPIADRPFDQILDAIKTYEDQTFRARVVTKLITAAFDHREDERLPALFELAKSYSEPGSRLHQLIKVEESNLLLARLDWDEVSEADPFSEYRWVDDLIAQSAEKAAVSRVEMTTTPAWTITLGFGGSPLSSLWAASYQVRWAGAIWLKRSADQQLATAMLSADLSAPDDHAQAVGLWAVSRGSKVDRIANASEPFFDESSADKALGYVMRSGPLGAKFNTVLLDLSIELWDVITPGVAVELLDRFVPAESDHPIVQNINTLWSLLSMRTPDEWEQRFLNLDDEEARGLLTSTMPAVAKLMPEGGARRLLRLAETGETIPASAAALVKTLEERFGVEEEIEFADELEPEALIRLAELTDEAPDENRLQRAIAKLTANVEEIAQDSLQGKSSFGSGNPINSLTKGLIISKILPDPTFKVLERIVVDESIPLHVRYDVLRALTALAAEGLISAHEGASLVDRIPEAGAQSFYPQYTSVLLRGQKDSFAMVLGLRDEYMASTLLFSRDREPRVRIGAMETASLGRSNSNDSLLESILLNGLFDPDPNVTRTAVSGFTTRPPESRATQSAVIQRLAELFEIGDRTVRAAVARLSAHGEPPKGLSGSYEALRNRALSDRCFSVRREVDRAGLHEA